MTKKIEEVTKTTKMRNDVAPQHDQGKTGAAPADADAQAEMGNAGQNNGLGFNGEFRIGAITLAQGGDAQLELRHENVGTRTKVAEAVLEGVLEEAFFQRKIDEDGNENLGLTGKE